MGNTAQQIAKCGPLSKWHVYKLSMRTHTTKQHASVACQKQLPSPTWARLRKLCYKAVGRYGKWCKGKCASTVVSSSRGLPCYRRWYTWRFVCGLSCENRYGNVLTFTCPCATTIGGSHSPGSMWPVSVNLELSNTSVPPLKQKGWAYVALAWFKRPSLAV